MIYKFIFHIDLISKSSTYFWPQNKEHWHKLISASVSFITIPSSPIAVTFIRKDRSEFLNPKLLWQPSEKESEILEPMEDGSWREEFQRKGKFAKAFQVLLEEFFLFLLDLKLWILNDYGSKLFFVMTVIKKIIWNLRSMNFDHFLCLFVCLFPDASVHLFCLIFWL